MAGDLIGGQFIGLARARIAIKPDKGQLNGSCNREACQKPGAVWFNRSTRQYYCPTCAHEINRWNPEGLNGSPLCEEVKESE